MIEQGLLFQLLAVRLTLHFVVIKKLKYGAKIRKTKTKTCSLLQYASKGLFLMAGN